MALRSNHPAFDGEFELQYSNDSGVVMAWRNGTQHCQLSVDLKFRTTTISLTDRETVAEIAMRC